MKKKLFCLGFVISVMCFNFSLKSFSDRVGNPDTLDLVNISLLQSNATEEYCDKRDKEPCTGTTPGGTEIKSTGYWITVKNNN